MLFDRYAPLCSSSEETFANDREIVFLYSSNEEIKMGNSWGASCFEHLSNRNILILILCVQ